MCSGLARGLRLSGPPAGAGRRSSNRREATRCDDCDPRAGHHARGEALSPARPERRARLPLRGGGGHRPPDQASVLPPVGRSPESEGVLLALVAAGAGGAALDHPAQHSPGHGGTGRVLHRAPGDGLRGPVREDALVPVLAAGHPGLAHPDPRRGQGRGPPRGPDMFERLPRLDAAVDRAAGPVTRFLYRRLGITADQVTWASFGVTLVAAAVIARGHLYAGLALMALGQALDHFDGAVARLSEAAIFFGMVAAGLVSLKLALLAFTAILLLTSVSERSRLDPGCKRFVLYFGPWVAYPKLFGVIFAANLIAYVIGLLILDIHFQRRMDALGGDLDTVASRAAESEAEERQPLPAPRSA